MQKINDWDSVQLEAQRTQDDYDQPRIAKSEEEWQQLLPAPLYQIARQHGTEHPFSAPDKAYASDVVCACCAAAGERTVLFEAPEKYDSGSGWPSFKRAAKDEAIRYVADHSRGMVRMEVKCVNCDAHLGHVFPDGPAPTGLRYCINGLAIEE